MGKKGSKYRGTVPYDFLINAVNTKPIKELLPAAKIVCGSDWAVYYYNNKKHHNYYHNDEAFRKALRRCITMNAFNHCQILIDKLGLEWEYEEYMQEKERENNIET